MVESKYELKKDNKKPYLVLKKDLEGAIYELDMYPVWDILVFNDSKEFKTPWDVADLSCFSELKNYERLYQMSNNELLALAKRIKSRIEVPKGRGIKTIQKELIELKKLEKKVLETGVKIPEKTQSDLESIKMMYPYLNI